MFSAERSAKILALENLRKSRIVTLVTSVRQGLAASLADEQVRLLYDHLLHIRGARERIPRLDLFIVSNGGDSTIPWRLISAFREFADHVGVLVPYRAYSAATLTAIGADEIVMGPFGQLGPIDPTVQNDFNPLDERTNQRIGISVEDVKSYLQFIKTTAEIKGESDVMRAVEGLVAKVHPLALGNVERFIQQSRLIAKKLLKTHMKDEAQEGTIEIIVDHLASKLYFHGHPISRAEAADELHLPMIVKSNRQTDDALWDLYLEYEKLFEMDRTYNPAIELSKLRVAAPGLQQNYQAGYNAAIAGGANQVQAIQLGMAHAQGMQPVGIAYDATLVAAVVESSSLSDVLRLKQRSELLPEVAPGQMTVRQELLEQEWLRSEPPASGQTAGA
ncbi:MAG: hypothetical protein WAN59_03595 [Candidatus Baltobacteraceae bacterium]